MTKTLTLFAATTALTAVLGLPAWSAMHAPGQGGATVALTSLAGAVDASRLLVLIDDDEDDDEGTAMQGRKSDDDEEDDEECDDDEGSCGAAAPAPAPAGSVAPPKNGLFGTGTPQVQVK